MDLPVFIKGEKVSIQGTGMGMPSMHIYASELIQNYGAKKTDSYWNLW